MRKRVERLFPFRHGVLVGIREKYVKECIEKNDALHILYGDDVMTLDPESLRDKVIMTSNPVNSKYGKEERLVNYKWDPNISTDD